jgi:hypothetical protein
LAKVVARLAATTALWFKRNSKKSGQKDQRKNSCIYKKFEKKNSQKTLQK